MTGAPVKAVKLCECGCGLPAPIAQTNHQAKGHVKGQALRFVSGHNGRGRPKSAATREKMAAYASNRPAEHHEQLVRRRRARPLSDTTDPRAIHSWLVRHCPKTGTCEECGTAAKTDFAFKNHPAVHTRDRNDYRELCRSCHVEFDYAVGARGKAAAA